MINQLLAWAKTPRPVTNTFQLRHLQAVGNPRAWFPSSTLPVGVGVNNLPTQCYGSADDVFNWYCEKLKNSLRLPHISVGKTNSDFLKKDEGWMACGAQVDGRRWCLFNSSFEVSEREEQICFFHEAAHTLGFTKHDRWFLAMHLLLNLRSGFEFSADEVDYEQCISEDSQLLNAAEWAEDYAFQNYKKDLTAIELAEQLLILQSENL